ncbi:MAG: hypothetical protein MUF54_21975 [Polyangiaceae bacterium]|jgi:hypothetical protein|nr:hypothetical protein [Polyangiaceae bacterium]
MKRTLDVEPARRAECEGGLESFAIMTCDEVISRISSFLRSPTVPAPLGPAGSPACDVTVEVVRAWVVNVDRASPDDDARAPPCEWSAFDPPAADWC